MAAYTSSLANITSTILSSVRGFNTSVLYFATTIPGGSAEPASAADNLKVQALNKAARGVMAAAGIKVLDLYQTMKSCGTACTQCKPHCQPAGYSYLVDNAIAPAVRAALPSKCC